MESLEQLLRSYQMLSPGWDGYGGVPAHPSSVEDALTWLTTLPTENPLPLSMLAGDGEVSLYWSCPEVIYLEVSFPGDATCHFIANRDKERYGSDDLDISVAAQDATFLRFYNLAMDNKRNVDETHG